MHDSGAHRLALGATALAVGAWGLGPVIVHEISADLPTTVFWRLWLAVPLWALLARRSGDRISLRAMARLWLPGVLFLGSMLASFASYRTTSIANAALISSMTPLVIFAFAHRQFGERVGLRLATLGAIALAGTAMVIFGAGKTSGASIGGDLLAVAALASFSVYFMRAKHLREAGMSTGTLLLGVFAWCAVLNTPYALVASGDLGALRAKDWVLVTAMVLGPGLIGHGLITWAQHRVAITTSSLMTLGSPVVSTLVAWLVSHQRLRWLQAVGMVVVLVALALTTLSAKATVPAPGEMLAEQASSTLPPVDEGR